MTATTARTGRGARPRAVVGMYRLVTGGLLAVLVAAVVASAIGALPWRPAVLAGHAAVAVGVSVAASWLAARAVRRVPHVESAVITGLLLAALFWPLPTPASFAVVAVAAVLAAATKVLVVAGGRHLLNPAAAGALLAGVGAQQLGLAPGAAWWVATPVLLPLVALTGWPVLRRTGREAAVVAYLAVAVGITALRLAGVGPGAGAGVGIGAALWGAVASYPWVFAACFMLTEPLTAPPRRRQQVAVAVLAAIVAAVPWHVGPLVNTPELGLVVGNLAAFALAPRRGSRWRLAVVREVTPRVREVVLRADRAGRLRVLPGQYVEVGVPHRRPDGRGSRRTFSPVAAPGWGTPGGGVPRDGTPVSGTAGDVATPEGHGAPRDGTPGELRVAFTVPEDGPVSSFKRSLALPAGSEVHVTSMAGDFLLPADPAEPVVLVAAGIGITPFVGRLAADAAAGVRRDAVVVVLARSAAELAYAGVLAAAGVEVHVLTPDAPDPLPPGWHHHDRRADAALLGEIVPGLTARTAYLAGPPATVRALRRELRRAGVRRVRTDVFRGY